MGNFFLKHYRTPDWQALLQNVIRPCKADLEWHAAQQVAGLGLQTFETVAVGRRRRCGLVADSFLITREIPGVEPLDKYVLETFSDLRPFQKQRARRAIARQLGEITARLHRGGLLHRDLHPGNLLIQSEGEQCQLYLIDLHALNRKRSLSPRTSAYNLSLLNNFFARLTSRSDRMRFLAEYRDAWNGGHSDDVSFTREKIRLVEQICERELQKADRRGDKKWQRGNRRLIILDDSPDRCRGVAELGRDLLQVFQEKPEALFDAPYFIAWEANHQTRKAAVIELPLDGNPQRVIVIAFRQPKLARNAWEMGHALIRRRLRAPRPLFFVETQTGDWDYLVIEDIPNAVSFAHHLWKQFDSYTQSQWDRWIKRVVTLVAGQLRLLHDHGFHQTNLRLDSLRIHENDSHQIWFDSIESIQQVSNVSDAEVMESLANAVRSFPKDVPISGAQCLRFLRVYLGSRSAREWKTFWRGTWSLIRRTSHKEAA